VNWTLRAHGDDGDAEASLGDFVGAGNLLSRQNRPVVADGVRSVQRSVSVQIDLSGKY